MYHFTYLLTTSDVHDVPPYSFLLFVGATSCLALSNSSIFDDKFLVEIDSCDSCAGIVNVLHPDLIVVMDVIA